jgi:hypothetical protein
MFKKIIPFILIALTSCTITSRRYMGGFYVERNSKKVNTHPSQWVNNDKPVEARVIDAVPAKQNVPAQVSFTKTIESAIKTVPAKTEKKRLTEPEIKPVRSETVSAQPIKITDDNLPKSDKKARAHSTALKCLLFGVLAFLLMTGTILLLITAANIATIYFIATAVFAVIFGLLAISKSQFVENCGESFASSSIGLILGIVGGLIAGIILLVSLVGAVHGK